MGSRTGPLVVGVRASSRNGRQSSWIVIGWGSAGCGGWRRLVHQRPWPGIMVSKAIDAQRGGAERAALICSVVGFLRIT